MFNFIIDEYLEVNNLLDWDKKNTFIRRAANAVRFGTRNELLPRRNGKILYFLTDVPYLDELVEQLNGEI